MTGAPLGQEQGNKKETVLSKLSGNVTAADQKAALAPALKESLLCPRWTKPQRHLRTQPHRTACKARCMRTRTRTHRAQGSSLQGVSPSGSAKWHTVYTPRRPHGRVSWCPRPSFGPAQSCHGPKPTSLTNDGQLKQQAPGTRQDTPGRVMHMGSGALAARRRCYGWRCSERQAVKAPEGSGRWAPTRHSGCMEDDYGDTLTAEAEHRSIPKTF